MHLLLIRHGWNQYLKPVLAENPHPSSEPLTRTKQPFSAIDMN